MRAQHARNKIIKCENQFAGMIPVNDARTSISFRHSILRQQFEEEGKKSTLAIDQRQPMFVEKCDDRSREKQFSVNNLNLASCDSGCLDVLADIRNRLTYTVGLSETSEHFRWNRAWISVKNSTLVGV
jgi:hypothetical protein